MTTVVHAAADDGLQNKFLVVVLAAQRFRQLQSGARPRAESDGHRFPWIAVREVITGQISWDLAPLPPTGAAQAAR